MCQKRGTWELWGDDKVNCTSKTNIKWKVGCVHSGSESMKKEPFLLTRKDINFAVSCGVIVPEGTTEEEWVDEVSNSIESDSLQVIINFSKKQLIKIIAVIWLEIVHPNITLVNLLTGQSAQGW